MINLKQHAIKHYIGTLSYRGGTADIHPVRIIGFQFNLMNMKESRFIQKLSNHKAREL